MSYEEEDDDEDLQIKIIIIGNRFTGKTCLVNKWAKNIFDEAYKPTKNTEFVFKVFQKDTKFFRIQIWDINGETYNLSVAKIFAKDSDRCIIVSDATNKKTSIIAICKSLSKNHSTTLSIYASNFDTSALLMSARIIKYLLKLTPSFSTCRYKYINLKLLSV